jgi:hypothetical protein
VRGCVDACLRVFNANVRARARDSMRMCTRA